MSSTCCTERSHGVYHIANIPIGAGVQVPAASIDPDSIGNVFKVLSVINDTDQDIKVKYTTTEGSVCNFIVPKSIKGFTRALKGSYIDNNTVYLISLHSANDAVGNVSLNFGS